MLGIGALFSDLIGAGDGSIIFCLTGGDEGTEQEKFVFSLVSRVEGSFIFLLNSGCGVGLYFLA